VPGPQNIAFQRPKKYHPGRGGVKTAGGRVPVPCEGLAPGKDGVSARRENGAVSGWKGTRCPPAGSARRSRESGRYAREAQGAKWRVRDKGGQCGARERIWVGREVEWSGVEWSGIWAEREKVS
jgi:hypothetical protein